MAKTNKLSDSEQVAEHIEKLESKLAKVLEVLRQIKNMSR